jgi:hypothetical protein
MTYIQANWRKSWQKPALQRVKKPLKDYREKAPFYMVIPSYEKNASQDLDDFDRIAQDLGKFARPAS